MSTELYGLHSPSLADARVALASCLLDLGQRAAVAVLLAQAANSHATHALLAERYRQPLREARERLQGAPGRPAA